MRELIRQSYNHPSIVFWGIGNEQRSNDAATNQLLAELAALTREEDASRLSVYAHCCNPDTVELTRHTDAVGYNYYFGWYMGNYGEVGAWADAAHAAQPDTPISLSEYGAGASLIQHQEPAQQPVTDGPFHPEEYQTDLHEAYWLQLQSRPFVWSKLVWNLFDFAADTRDEGDAPGRNDKGLVSFDRQVRKDAFYWYKANWSSEPFVHVTGRRFNPRTTPSVDVKVYSNQPSVSLRVNGDALPAQSSPNHIFRFDDVPLEPGDNQIEAEVRVDGRVLRDAIVWSRQ
jgi:beta-galactosidase